MLFANRLLEIYAEGSEWERVSESKGKDWAASAGPTGSLCDWFGTKELLYDKGPVFIYPVLMAAVTPLG